VPSKRVDNELVSYVFEGWNTGKLWTGIVTFTSFRLPEGLDWLDRAAVMDTAGEKVRCRLGGLALGLF
jgi:hypothetical protein